jgi:hypothetical protein
MIPRRIVPWVAWALLLAMGAAALAEQPARRPQKREGKSEFIRIVRDKADTPVALETAIVRCAPADRSQEGPIVDLVAAVHVAERSYYQHLNREFAGYDVVLYELVAPEGKSVPRRGGGGGSPLSLVQNGLKDLLELEFQLNEIDYGRKNMVHADMSPDQLAKAMRERGESVFTIFLRMMGYALARQQASGPTDSQLLLALFDKHRALSLKRLMAEEFEDMEGSLMAIDGPKGSALLSERNKVVLGVLGQQLAAGKRKIAIFYGAGHMADLQRRLRQQYHLAPQTTRWLVAWKMSGAAQ